MPKLLQPSDLTRVPVQRLRDERLYWEGVEGSADMLRLMLAEFMLNDILATPDGVKERTDTVVDLGWLQANVVTRGDYSSYILAGLGLSQFLRRTGYLDEGYRFGTGREGAMRGGVFDLVTPRRAVRMHLPHETISGIIPDFDPQRPDAWYGDGLSVVHATQPPNITPDTKADYERMSGGLAIDESRLVTLIPHLTHAYLRPPAQQQ